MAKDAVVTCRMMLGLAVKVAQGRAIQKSALAGRRSSPKVTLRNSSYRLALE